MRFGRNLLISAFAVLILLLFAGTILFFIVPGYLESEVIPGVFQKSGIGDVRVEVRRLGMYGADLGPLRIGDEKHPALTVDSIRMDYTPGGLYGRRVDRVVLTGATLHARFESGRLYIPGLDRISLSPSEPSSRALSPSIPESPVKRLEIRHGALVFGWGKESLRIPFEAVLRTENQNLVSGIIHFYLRGQKLDLAASLEPGQGILRLEYQTEKIRLGLFSDLISRIPGWSVKGTADLSGKTEIRLSPFAVSSLDARLSVHEAMIDYGSLKLQNSPDGKGTDLPFEVSVKHTQSQGWQISATSIRAVSPFPLEMSELAAAVDAAGDGIVADGRLFLASVAGEEKVMPENLRLPVDFSLRSGPDGAFEFLLESKAPEKKTEPWTLAIPATDARLRGEAPEFRISGKGGVNEITAAFEAKLGGLDISDRSRSAKISRLSLEAKAGFDPNRGSGSATFTVRAPDLSYRHEKLSARLAGLSLDGSVERAAQGKFILDATVHVKDGQLSDSALGLAITGIRGHLPLRLPPGAPPEKGAFFALARYKNLEIGSLSGTFQQQKSGVAFSGRHAGKFFRNLVLDFSGNGEISPLAAKIHWSIPSYVLPTGMDLTPILPWAKGIECGGEVAMEGKSTLSPSGVRASLDLRLKDFNVARRKQEIAIAGIDMSLHMPELPEMRSAPDQKLSFETASWGKLKVSGGKAGFQVEPGPRLFLEGGEFAWADGRVYARSMRLSPDMKSIDGTLFCDRLNLAAILKQLGAFDMEGKGAVNGRIPVRISAGKVHIDDGFLYSTPGQGGKIRISDKDALAGLIPGGPGAIQQLEIAREALKNYDYDWVKVGLATEQDTLVLRMELDGKPADPLPFRYDAESGKFARDPSGKGSRFQGIRLDVNFRLPLDSLMHYGEAMEEMTKIEKLIN